MARISVLGLAPTERFMTAPFLITASVGMLKTLNCCAAVFNGIEVIFVYIKYGHNSYLPFFIFVLLFTKYTGKIFFIR